jgi:hypothetical protein
MLEPPIRERRMAELVLTTYDWVPELPRDV